MNGLAIAVEEVDMEVMAVVLVEDTAVDMIGTVQFCLLCVMLFTWQSILGEFITCLITICTWS